MALIRLPWGQRRAARLELAPTPEDEERKRAAARAWLSLPVLSIVAANLVPLWGAVFAGWEVLPLVVLFWFDYVIVLALATLHLLMLRAGLIRKLLPCFAAGVFAIAGLAAVFGGEAGQAGDIAVAAVAAGMLPEILALVAVHCVPFLVDVFRHRLRDADPSVIVNTQLCRMLFLALTLILGGILSALAGSPLWGLVALVLLKGFLEVAIHMDPGAGKGLH